MKKTNKKKAFVTKADKTKVIVLASSICAVFAIIIHEILYYSGF